MAGSIETPTPSISVAQAAEQTLSSARIAQDELNDLLIKMRQDPQGDHQGALVSATAAVNTRVRELQAYLGSMKAGQAQAPNDPELNNAIATATTELAQVKNSVGQVNIELAKTSGVPQRIMLDGQGATLSMMGAGSAQPNNKYAGGGNGALSDDLARAGAAGGNQMPKDQPLPANLRNSQIYQIVYQAVTQMLSQPGAMTAALAAARGGAAQPSGTGTGNLRTQAGTPSGPGTAGQTGQQTASQAANNQRLAAGAPSAPGTSGQGGATQPGTTQTGGGSGQGATQGWGTSQSSGAGATGGGSGSASQAGAGPSGGGAGGTVTSTGTQNLATATPSGPGSSTISGGQQRQATTTSSSGGTSSSAEQANQDQAQQAAREFQNFYFNALMDATQRGADDANRQAGRPTTSNTGGSKASTASTGAAGGGGGAGTSALAGASGGADTGSAGATGDGSGTSLDASGSGGDGSQASGASGDAGASGASTAGAGGDAGLTNDAAAQSTGTAASPTAGGATTQAAGGLLGAAQQGLGALSSAVTGDSTDGGYLGDPLLGNEDVNAIIQSVLLNVYKDGQSDLKDEAGRIASMNKQKRDLRNQKAALGSNPDPTAVKTIDDKIDSIGDDEQLAQLRLQDLAQKQQELLSMISNLSKNTHDNAMAIIRHIGGG